MSQPLIVPRRPKSANTTEIRHSAATIGFVNLGCSKNQVDSEIMLGALVTEGFRLTDDPRQAEVVIVNTCGFIEEAKEESINTILEHGQLKKRGACRVLIAAGCLAQRYQGDLLKELPELDAVVGTGEFDKIAAICRELLSPKKRHRRLWMGQPPYLYDESAPRVRLGTQHSAYVKIAEGCNRNCAFCAIPLMRGKQRSRPVHSIVAEVQQLAREGVQEINLISQDTINYGVDLSLGQGLVRLLRELVKIDGIRWIRPFYLYPQHVTDGLLDLYAEEEAITKYMDMPLQHINDAMLTRMHRLGNRVAVESLVDRIRSRIPGISFRTAFIVGFPGETDKAFDELYEFVERSQFDRVAVFLYSDEEGTGAVSLDHKVDRQVMEDRRNALLSLQESIAAAKGRARIGSVLDVLIDGRSQESGGVLEGRHEGLAPEIDGVVYIDEGTTDVSMQPASDQTASHLTAGSFCKIEITDAAAFDLVGRLVATPSP